MVSCSHSRAKIPQFASLFSCIVVSLPPVLAYPPALPNLCFLLHESDLCLLKRSHYRTGALLTKRYGWLNLSSLRNTDQPLCVRRFVSNKSTDHLRCCMPEVSFLVVFTHVCPFNSSPSSLGLNREVSSWKLATHHSCW